MSSTYTRTRRRQSKRLPKRPGTAAAKIIKQNPWQLGEALASLVTTYCWKELQAIPQQPIFDYIAAVTKIELFQSWCKKHHLAAHHVASTLFLVILK